MTSSDAMPADRIKSARAVVFDVGETLINEATEYGTWADWIGVPRHTFSAVFGAVIAQGRDYRETFQIFQPGFDLDTERKRRAEAGLGEHFDARDLYPDARPCLAALRDQGYFVGIAGNQTARAGRLLHELNLPTDMIATSEDWGESKPGRGFFDKLIGSVGVPANQMLYVGDRIDNDILPAHDAGLLTALIRRGPWSYILRDDGGNADLQIDSLDELQRVLHRRVNEWPEGPSNRPTADAPTS